MTSIEKKNHFRSKTLYNKTLIHWFCSLQIVFFFFIMIGPKNQTCLLLLFLKLLNSIKNISFDVQFVYQNLGRKPYHQVTLSSMVFVLFCSCFWFIKTYLQSIGLKLYCYKSNPEDVYIVLNLISILFFDHFIWSLSQSVATYCQWLCQYSKNKNLK